MNANKEIYRIGEKSAVQQSQLSRTTRPVPSGNRERKKKLISKKKEERERKIPRVYIWVQTKRAIQHLHDEFQIENINKNYGHANVRASDKSVMRMRKWLTKRKMFLIFFFQTANAAQLCRKGWNSTFFSKCNVTELQTFIHSLILLFVCLRVRGHFSSPSTISLWCLTIMFFPCRISLMMKDLCLCS